MRRTIALAMVSATLLHASPSAAQSEDAVVVLYNGGTDSVDVFDLTAAAPRSPINLGSRRVVPVEVGPVRISDIKILPDGSHLLADVDGRGAVVSTSDGTAFRWVLDEAQRFTDVDAASVASYFAPGEPSLVVTGDSAASNVAIRNTSQETTVWFSSVRLSVSRGFVPQVAVMPGNKLAMAINWPDIGVYGIRVRDTGDPLFAGTSILSGDHVEAPADAVIVPELDVIRDLMGLSDGRLLVTMRYAVAVLAADGTLDQLVDIGDLAPVSGELASVRTLPSGLWAIASFQPGEWIQPHTNHRVHWYDPALGEVIATSEPLPRAPLRVDAQRGHGGTSTQGFDAGLDLIQQGDPSTLQLVSVVVAPSTAIGERLNTRATLRNAGSLPVGLSSAAIRGQRGACGGALQPEVDFAVANSVALNPGQEFTWVGNGVIDGTFATGPWCAYVQGVDRQGQIHAYGAPVSFTIEPAGQGSGTTIEVISLPFGVGSGADMGIDFGPMSDTGAGDSEPKGCCASVPRRSPAPLWLLVGLGLLSVRPWAAGRGRRRRHS